MIMVFIVASTAVPFGSPRKFKSPRRSDLKSPGVDLMEIIELINDVTKGFKAWWKLHAILLEFIKPILASAARTGKNRPSLEDSRR